MAQSSQLLQLPHQRQPLPQLLHQPQLLQLRPQHQPQLHLPK